MGNLLKILGAAGAAVGVGVTAIAAAASALNPKKKLEELESEWQTYYKEYLKNSSKLEAKRCKANTKFPILS